MARSVRYGADFDVDAESSRVEERIRSTLASLGFDPSSADAHAKALAAEWRATIQHQMAPVSIEEHAYKREMPYAEVCTIGFDEGYVVSTSGEHTDLPAGPSRVRVFPGPYGIYGISGGTKFRALDVTFSPGYRYYLRFDPATSKIMKSVSRLEG